MGEEEERTMGRRPLGSEDGENMPSISPALSDLVKLLGSWTWSSALQSQRHSWAPPAELSLSHTLSPRHVFSLPVGPKHRPCLPPKPHPGLSPAPHSQGLFWLLFFSPLFTTVVLLYILVVVSSK